MPPWQYQDQETVNNIITWVIFPGKMEMSVFTSHGDGVHIFCEDRDATVPFLCAVVCPQKVSPDRARGLANFS